MPPLDTWRRATDWSLEPCVTSFSESTKHTCINMPAALGVNPGYRVLRAGSALARRGGERAPDKSAVLHGLRVAVSVSDPSSVLLQHLLPTTSAHRFADGCATSESTGWTRRVIPRGSSAAMASTWRRHNPDRPATAASTSSSPVRCAWARLPAAAPDLPADGAISQFGPIKRPDLPGQGAPLTPAPWWAATWRWRRQFQDGHFATIYRPRDTTASTCPAIRAD